MAQFTYRGKNLQNQTVKGVIEATSQSACYAELKKQDIFAYSVTEKGGTDFRRHKLNATELADFARQVGTMQSSGIPIVRAIEIMKDRVSNAGVLRVYHQLSTSISAGHTLSEAMLTCQNSFPSLMIHMVQAGEANGRLDDSAAKMAEYYEREHKINTKIKGAMAYPCVLAVVTLCVVLILFTFVLPKMFDLIESGGGEITGLTAIILGISKFLIHQWYLALLVAAAFVALVIFTVRQNQREVDKLKLSIPKIGRLLSIIYTARFARTLSSLYSSGVTMIDGVEMSAKTIGNRHMEDGFISVVQRIRNGESLSRSIENTPGIEKKLVSSIYVGEETGRLDQMLAQLSEEYEFESASAIERMLSYLEPAMLIVMAIIIAVVLMSVMTPMMQMYSSIG